MWFLYDYKTVVNVNFFTWLPISVFFVLQTIVLVLAFDKLLCNRLNFKVEMKRERTALLHCAFEVRMRTTRKNDTKVIQTTFNWRLEKLFGIQGNPAVTSTFCQQLFEPDVVPQENKLFTGQEETRYKMTSLVCTSLGKFWNLTFISMQKKNWETKLKVTRWRESWQRWRWTFLNVCHAGQRLRCHLIHASRGEVAFSVQNTVSGEQKLRKTTAVMLLN